MNLIVFGAAGFIGLNLIKRLKEDSNNKIVALDEKREYFNNEFDAENVEIQEFNFCMEADFDKVLYQQDVVYHLVSTSMPSTSNKKISDELQCNIIVTAKLLEACVRQGVKKIIFISSGGTVYGKDAVCPIIENTNKKPITAYGLQKSTIEELLYLFNYVYGLDYRILRLSNPYGPFQRPNGMLGAVTNFTYKALVDEPVVIFGDGKVIRDYIYIDDAIDAIINIATKNTKYNIYNIGSGKGTNLLSIVDVIEKVLGKKVLVQHVDARQVDILENYLDVKRYMNEFGCLERVRLEEGVLRTAQFLKKHYIDF